MGLFDAVLGALESQAGGGPNWMGLISGLLANDSAHGGLAGVLQQLQAGGLGAHADSWVGTGANLPVTGEQLSGALGGLIGQLANQAGVSHGQASDMLAQLLPQVINHLTPQGQVPQGGLGGAADILGMLGGLLGVPR